ncbi:NUDIX hydrolase [Nakamurella aerolata]|uniref:NUDIX domain-containing protein n=1 Tax=Nakamurella aerolata TaxID=1656892 RepID=A0A849A8H0_9ACTN|nr:NUDIX domain-containing protein [Nakamurella aerolata]NNG35813.1 NUDIX domain-containing protein [Nakamurella aerolata]
MPVPEFVTALRSKIGTDPLWLIGCTAVVTRGDAAAPQLLLVRRADNGAWTPVTGIVDPGEHPSVAAVREVLEETAVTAKVVRLAQVGVTRQVRYPNGDQTQYLDLTYRLRYRTGRPRPADDENTDARWVPVAELGAAGNRWGLSAAMQARVSAALADEAAPRQVLLEG